MKMLKKTRLAFVVLLIVFGMFSLATAQGESAANESEEANRQALIDAAAALTAGDYEAVDALLAEDYVVHTPLGDLDSAGLIGFFTGLHASLSDFNMVREQVIVEGDWAATHLTLTGTFDEAEFPSPMGVLPPNGQPIVVTVVNMFHFNEDGQVVEEWAQFDVLGFFTQLGAFPAA